MAGAASVISAIIGAAGSAAPTVAAAINQRKIEREEKRNAVALANGPQVPGAPIQVRPAPWPTWVKVVVGVGGTVVVVGGLVMAAKAIRGSGNGGGGRRRRR